MLRTTYLILTLAASSYVHSANYEWSSGWGMGVSEYQVDDGNSNRLLISCPDYEEDGYIHAFSTINGKKYDSEEDAGFNVIIDGETYQNPFFTDCRVCGENFRNAFWESLRNANQLKLSAENVTIQLPTQKIKGILPAINSPENTCKSAW